MPYPLLHLIRILLGAASLVGWILSVAAFLRVRRMAGDLEMLRQRLDRQEPPPAPRPVPTVVQAAPPLPPPLPPPPPVVAQRRNIEALLTLRWGMWVGAAALLLSGVFLVRYAADEGWVTAPVRCAGLAVLGAVLVAAAEVLQRRRPAVSSQAMLPDLAPAALAAGGVSMLFAGAYAAGSVYRLVPPAASFVLTASVSLAALFLSLRFGRLVAAIGIGGAFATPLLVQDGQASPPLLFAYLLLVVLAGLLLQRRTGWSWLGWVTLAAGGAWTGLAWLLPGAAPDSWSMWAPALFAPLLAALHLGGGWAATFRRRAASIVIPAAPLLLAATLPATIIPVGLLLLVPVAMRGGGRDVRIAWLGAAGPLLLLGIWSWPGWMHGTPALAPFGPVPATAAAAAILLGLHGLWMQRREPRAQAWATLPAILPAASLAVWHLHPLAPQHFPGLLGWLAVLVVLAAGLSTCARRDRAAAALAPGAVHAAGAAAALGLALAGTLEALGVPLGGAAGLAPLLPALALIARTGLPSLRPVALAVAATLLAWPFVALAWTPSLLDDRQALVARLPSVMVLVVCFGLSSRLFVAGLSDRLDRLLDAGTALLTALLVAMLVRGLGRFALPGPDFAEAAMQTAALWLEALLWLRLSQRLQPAPGDRPWQATGLGGLVGSVLLMLLSPLLLPATVGAVPVLDALLPAYGVPALGAALGAAWLARDSRMSPAPVRWLSGFSLVSGFVWLTLEVRHLFHPVRMTLGESAIGEIELWVLSCAWLGFGALLMAAGLLRPRPLLRQAGLIILVLTVLKVLLIDTGGLAGIWRVLSFLALGLTLIALGAAYRRFGTETFTAPDVADHHKPEEQP